MTQEEKAKAYDDAIKRAKRMFSEKELNYLFPELAESDDEKIISAIRKAIEAKVENLGNGVTRTACLAWLEKQGEPIDEEKVDNQNCVKPSVKGEPKFKVGDWYIDNEDGTIFQIVKVLDNTYSYRTNEGKDYSCTHYSLELDARLWNMSDAKEGDVLFMDNLASNCIFIYKSSNNGVINKYASYNKFGFEGEHYLVLNDGYVIPATKEQRDTLMKAMADAGYTFDFEKKELKVIENEEYDGEDYGIDSLWHAKNILEKTLGKVDGYQTDDGILDHKCAISAVNKLCKEDAKITNRWNPSDEHIHWLKWVINRMPDTEKANEAEVVLKDLLEQLEEL